MKVKSEKVVKQRKNSRRLKWTWSGARFVKEKTGQTRFENQKPSLRYKRARYYHAQLGRFISRDPLGFVDGMSLYRAYFVPGGLDPSGLDCIGCKGNVITGGEYVPKSAPANVPWEDKAIPERPGTPIGNATLGFTATQVTVKCDEQCEKCPDGKFRPTNCHVILKFCIFIDVTEIMRRPDRTVDGTYGHEQRHIRNIIRWFERYSQSIHDAVNAVRFDNEQQCWFAGESKIDGIIIGEFLPYNNDTEATHGNGNPNFVPKAGTDYDPIGKRPNVATGCFGLVRTPYQSDLGNKKLVREFRHENVSVSVDYISGYSDHCTTGVVHIYAQ